MTISYDCDLSMSDIKLLKFEAATYHERRPHENEPPLSGLPSGEAIWMEGHLFLFF